MPKTKPSTVSEAAQQRALELVAAWIGGKGYGPWICGAGRPVNDALRHADDNTECNCAGSHCGPAPHGHDAAHRGLGPELIPDWDWPSSGPTPTVILEGGPDEWAIECAATITRQLQAEGHQVWTEPYSSYALCLYVND